MKMKEKTQLRLSKQNKRKILGELNWNLEQKLENMISNNKLESYDLLSSRIEKKYISVSYLLYMKNKSIENFDGFFDLQTRSFSYKSSLPEYNQKIFIDYYFNW
jgi:hypothetical protein